MGAPEPSAWGRAVLFPPPREEGVPAKTSPDQWAFRWGCGGRALEELSGHLLPWGIWLMVHAPLRPSLGAGMEAECDEGSRAQAVHKALCGPELAASSSGLFKGGCLWGGGPALRSWGYSSTGPSRASPGPQEVQSRCRGQPVLHSSAGGCCPLPRGSRPEARREGQLSGCPVKSPEASSGLLLWFAVPVWCGPKKTKRKKKKKAYSKIIHSIIKTLMIMNAFIKTVKK